ncbi:MAG TPA: thioesterase family protein, partial [Solirubrobacterales bacterium]|nr:thioesterase family protein [Solirubrobacterales bacterium]
MGLALAAHSKAWEGPLLGDATMPEVDPPDDPDSPQASMERDDPPAFLERMVMQHRLGPPPFSSAERGEVGGWLGIKDAERMDALAIAVLADAWFPAPWPRLPEFAPAPTIDLTLHFRSPLPVDAELLLGRFTNSCVRDGFFEEDGELWAPDGTLVAQSRQLGLLLGAKDPAGGR